MRKVPKAQLQDMINQRKKWLAKNKLSIPLFAQEVRLKYYTVIKWFSQGRSPEGLYGERVLRKYPDFPMPKGIRSAATYA